MRASSTVRGTREDIALSSQRIADYSTQDSRPTRRFAKAFHAACMLTIDLVRTRWAFAGLSLLFAWNTLSPAATGAVELGRWLDLAGVLYLARCASLLCIGFQSERFIARVRNPRMLMLAAALGVGAVFANAILLSISGDGANAAVLAGLALCSIITGATQSFLMMAWFARYAELPFVPLVFYFVGSNAISTAIPGVLFSLSSPVATSMVLVLLPAASCAMLLKAEGEAAKRSADEREASEPQPKTGSWSFPLRPALLIAIFAFTAGYARCFFDTSGSIRFDLLGGSLTALAMLAVAVRTEVKFNLKWFHWIALPLAVMAVILVGHQSHVIGLFGGYCATIGFMFIQFFVCISLCTISFRYNINPLWLLAPVQSLRFLGSFLGELVGRAETYGIVPLSEFDVSEILIIVICITYATFLTSRETDRSWGIEPVKGSSDENPASHRASYELLKDECARMARRYGLTLREEEVMFLLAQGQTQAKIEQELFISNATVKTHCSHVYAKLGISGKAELVELFKNLEESDARH